MHGFFAYFLAPIHFEAIFEFFKEVPQILWSLIPRFGAWVVLLIVAYLIFELGLVRTGPIWMWLLSLARPKLVFMPAVTAKTLGNPLVSVVVPALNEAETIARSLNSLLRCGYENLEIILVSDGSSDDTVPIAQRVASQVRCHPKLKRMRIRVFEAPRNNGRASALNVGLSQARGEFAIVMDADSEIQAGAIQHWLRPFADPMIAAVAGDIRVANSAETLLTRLQDIEYSTMMALYPLVVSRLRLLGIVPGQGGMFRMSVLRRIGFYDTGLGDDTDLTLRILKTGYRITYCLEAVVWTHVPPTLRGLINQRRRWTKNRVRIRLSKHRDMLSPRLRYGWLNWMVAMRNLIRCQEPGVALVFIAAALYLDPLNQPLWLPGVLTGYYFFALLRFWVKMMMSRDLAGTPSASGYWILPLVPFYSLLLRIVVNLEIVNEALKIHQYNAYVPRHVWKEVPRW
jgi:cellulose synthase/poly-beta-1,6-N-acetylglucosamine synthase-like glycosyltransferase